MAGSFPGQVTAVDEQCKVTDFKFNIITLSMWNVDITNRQCKVKNFYTLRCYLWYLFLGYGMAFSSIGGQSLTFTETFISVNLQVLNTLIFYFM